MISVKKYLIREKEREEVLHEGIEVAENSPKGKIAKLKVAILKKVGRVYKILPVLIILFAFVAILSSNYFFTSGVTESGRMNKADILPPVLLTNNEAWKTFNDTKRSISFSYPNWFVPSDQVISEDYYETVGAFVFNNEAIGIKAINNMDIYKGAKAIDVAKREIIDLGQTYTINDNQIQNYDGAITTLDYSTIITIAHPTKNLFVAITLIDMPKVEFDQILSSFEFTDV